MTVVRRVWPRGLKPAALLAVLTGIGLGMGTSCARAGSPGKSQSPPLSPRQTVARLIELRDAGAYQQMTPLIVPERATDVVVTLVAVQDFLSANEQLCGVVRRHAGIGLAQAIDQSQRAYHLDIFSKYVELLDEAIAGDAATVSFTVDGRLPARRTQLRRLAGTWRYDPGPGAYQQLADAFQKMARGLRQAMQEIETGRLTAQEMRDHPDRVIEEVRVRLLPGVSALPPSPTTQRAGAP